MWPWLRRWIGLAALVAGTAASDTPPQVLVARLENEAITPATVRFLERVITSAADREAECLVIVLDTPGGLVDSTRVLVKAILSSPVPIVVYVAPSGGRAASAGVFITIAAHVAAMAPGTNIGAAHPVPLGGLPVAPPGREPPRPDGRESPESEPAAATPAEAKTVNDTVAWARSLAELRGRSSDWVERAVVESVSVPAGEAVTVGAVDLVADDLAELLRQIDGREVQLPAGVRTLRTAGADVVEEPMWWGERALAALANPTLAFLLLMIGFYGVLFELYSPGWGVPGTLGVVCLALSFFSLAVLPVRFAGLLLITVGLAMFVAEVFATAYGALALGGVTCIVLGGLMLVESPAGFVGVSLNVLLPFAVATGLITFLLVAGVMRAHRRRAATGAEGQLGAVAVAEADFQPAPGGHAGTVWMHGEHWQATSAEAVPRAAQLEVVGRDGLTLRVRPAAGSKPAGLAPLTTSPLSTSPAPEPHS